MDRVFSEFSTRMGEDEFKEIFERNLNMVGFYFDSSEEIDYAGRPGSISVYVDENGKEKIEVLFVPGVVIGFWSFDKELVEKCERMYRMIEI